MADPRKPIPSPILDPRVPRPGPRLTLWDQATAELSELDAGLPIALLPVRIETKFTADSLVVRVYPDGLHADSLKRELSAAEWKHALEYKAAADKAAAWRVLTEAVHGLWRAAYVVHATAGGKPALDEREPVTRLRLLPKRWVVVGILDGDEVIRAAGRNIPADLRAGVDLDDAATTSAADLLRQPATRWIADLDHAIAQGMALRIPLTEAVRAKGLDTLLVFGASERDPAVQREELAGLLDAHRYTRGLGFLAQGEPTNRGAEDPDLLRSTKPPQPVTGEPPADSAARVLARALGLDATALADLDGANDLEQKYARAMNTVIWPVTGGALLWDLRHGDGKPMLSEDDVQEVREHFIRDVRGPGPLPTLRVGATPYGFLPICGLPAQVDGDNLHVRLWRVLQHLLGSWRKAVAKLPRVDSRADDSATDKARDEDDLYEVLAEQPWPERFALRQTDPDSPLLAARTKPLDEIPVGARFSYLTHINLLGAAGLKADELPPLGPHSPTQTLLDYDEQVVAWSRSIAGLPAANRRTSELPRPDVRDPSRREIAAVDPVDSLLELIVRLGQAALQDSKHRASVAHRNAEREAIDAAFTELRGAPESVRARVLGQSLGLAATRLDAWITATATRRLAGLRSKRPAELQVGAWGVVHGLRPAGAAASAGYALTPSLGQAAAAVALRSGHAAYSTSGSSPYAVDLSSERVRLARWLYDGVRQGQSLGALLGNRYERLLHEHGADVLVRQTRVAALAARKREGDAPVQVVDGLLVARALAPVADPTKPEQTLAQRLTSDKILENLGQKARGRLAALDEKRPIAALTHADEQRLAAGLEQHLARTFRRVVAVARVEKPQATLANLWLSDAALGKIAVEPLLDALDALADTATFETTHQLLGGDWAAAGTVLAAVDRGEAPPPALRSLDTPRGGVTVSHRVILALAPATASTWPAEQSAAALAEPRLERWAADVLGEPRAIRLVVEHRDAATGALLRRDRVSLADLAPIGALDFCRLCAAGGWRDGPLAARLLVEQAAARAADERLALADDGELAGAQIGLAEAHAIAASLARAWRGGRPATPGELSPLRGPDSPEPLRALDRSELQQRVTRVRDRLDRLRADLEAAAGGERPALLARLTALIAFGGAGPLAPPVDVVDEPLAQLRERVPGLQAALAAAATELAEALVAPADDAQVLARGTAALQRVVGEGMPVLPLYKAAGGLARSALGTALRTDEATIAGWFGQLARVRPRIDALDAALRLAEVRHDRPPFTLRAGQPGAGPDDLWAAIGRPPGDRPCLCITAVLGPNADPDGDAAVLAIDAWSERVPARDVLGGLALQIPSPAAEAPQVVLLATLSPGTERWSLAELQRSVAAALPLAQIRAVPQDRLESLGHLLPCIFLDGARVPIETGGSMFLDFGTLVKHLV